MSTRYHPTRRDFLQATAAAGAGLTMAALPHSQATVLAADDPAAKPKGEKRKPEEAEEVTPAEDLMREHGAMRRLLLVYDECGRRLRRQKELDPKTIQTAAGIFRRFVEDYHEKLEEDYLFPKMQKNRELAALTKVLLQQHAAGRKLTDRIKALATKEQLQSADNCRQLANSLTAFNRMYRPHAAREDTVLFPAMHEVFKPADYDTLGDVFEKREDELFGEHGFEKMVDQVAELEKTLGIHDLASFTPKIK
jgi:hemerythrin-like domain-containing protein